MTCKCPKCRKRQLGRAQERKELPYSLSTGKEDIQGRRRGSGREARRGRGKGMEDGERRRRQDDREEEDVEVLAY